MTEKDAMIEAVARIVDDEITKRGSSSRETAVSVLLTLAPFMQAREQAAREEEKRAIVEWLRAGRVPDHSDEGGCPATLHLTYHAHNVG